jgi:hypothetical protein
MLRISWNTQNFTLADSGDLEAASYEHTLEFDVITSETHEGSSVLTEHAVESGAPISDHKRANPRRIAIEAIVSNTPLGAPPRSGYAETTIETSLSKDEGMPNVLVFSRRFDRIQDVLATLDRLRLEATSVTLTTSRRTYDAVQIVSVTEPRAPEDGDTQRFQIEIQEVRVAQSRTVEAPRPREPRGQDQRDRGGQEAQDDRRTSAIQRGRDEYDRRIAAGESRTDASMGAVGAMF